MTHYKEGRAQRVLKKEEFESVLMRWMKLEPIIQSEVSQKYLYSDFMNINVAIGLKNSIK